MKLSSHQHIHLTMIKEQPPIWAAVFLRDAVNLVTSASFHNTTALLLQSNAKGGTR